jgi:sterol desaturase/sphingolipid hydroxylase (fatty acid hydroxylase superfamily)
MHEGLESIGRQFLAALWEPIASLAQPDARVYLPFLVFAGVIASCVWFVQHRSGSSLVAYLFSRRIWWHRSAQLDYRLLFARALVQAFLFAPLSITALGVSWIIARFLWHHVAIWPRISVDAWWIVAAFSVSAFLAEDCARYWLHRLTHRVPFLWELHKVHHSAEVLTPFTVYRTHPIEGLLMRSGSVLAIGVTAGLFMWIFPGQLRAFEILGIYGLSFLWNLLGSNLRHSHVWLSYGPLLERVVMSPAQHQIHHSRAERHHDRNFGSELALWDLLWGTLYVTRGRERLRFGLARDMRNHSSRVASVLWDPLLAALRTLRR